MGLARLLDEVGSQAAVTPVSGGAASGRFVCTVFPHLQLPTTLATMFTRQTLIVSTIAFALGASIGLAGGIAYGWLAVARATIQCTGATEGFLRGANKATAEGRAEMVQAEIDALVDSGSALETYEPGNFAARLREASDRLEAHTAR